MVEQNVYEYLSQKLSVPVCLELREDLPDSFVYVEKVGSSWENHVIGTSFSIQSYGASLYEAASLNDTVKQAVLGMVSEDWVSGIVLDSDYNYTDPTTKRYRYQLVFDMTLF